MSKLQSAFYVDMTASGTSSPKSVKKTSTAELGVSLGWSLDIVFGMLRQCLSNQETQVVFTNYTLNYFISQT